MEYQCLAVGLGQLGKKNYDKETESECKIGISSNAVFFGLIYVLNVFAL